MYVCNPAQCYPLLTYCTTVYCQWNPVNVMIIDVLVKLNLSTEFPKTEWTVFLHALVLISPCILHSNDLFLFVFFLTYPKCTAAPMMHLCLLFMLMRLNPIGPLPSCARCLLIKTQSAVKSLKRPLEATFDLVLWPFTFLLGMLLYCSVLTRKRKDNLQA